MKYVFDTSAFIPIFNAIYESRFPSFWKLFNDIIENGKLISVREVLNEIMEYNNKTIRLAQWAEDNKVIFELPTDAEIEIVKNIFKEGHFQMLVPRKYRSSPRPVADPFLIAKAKVTNGVVVTLEEFKENGVKIPNVCKKFSVPCTNLEGFMEKENWTF